MPQCLCIVWDNPIPNRVTLSINHHFSMLWLPYFPILLRFLAYINASLSQFMPNYCIYCWLIGFFKRSMEGRWLLKSLHSITTHSYGEAIGTCFTLNLLTTKCWLRTFVHNQSRKDTIFTIMGNFNISLPDVFPMLAMFWRNGRTLKTWSYCSILCSILVCFPFAYSSLGARRHLPWPVGVHCFILLSSCDVVQKWQVHIPWESCMIMLEPKNRYPKEWLDCNMFSDLDCKYFFGTLFL